MGTHGITDAARRAGVSRQTLYRCIKSGRLSVATDLTGRSVVDSSELFRVFPPKAALDVQNDATAHALLQVRLEALERDNARLQADLDRERDEKRKLFLLLTDQRPKRRQSDSTPASSTPRRTRRTAPATTTPTLGDVIAGWLRPR